MNNDPIQLFVSLFDEARKEGQGEIFVDKIFKSFTSLSKDSLIDPLSNLDISLSLYKRGKL